MRNGLFALLLAGCAQTTDAPSVAEPAPPTGGGEEAPGAGTETDTATTTPSTTSVVTCPLCGYWLTPLTAPIMREGVFIASELRSFRFLGDSVVLSYAPFRPETWGAFDPARRCAPADGVYRFRARIDGGWLHFTDDAGDDVRWAEIEGDHFVDRPAPGVEYPVVRVADEDAPSEPMLDDLIAERPVFSCADAE